MAEITLDTKKIQQFFFFAAAFFLTFVAAVAVAYALNSYHNDNQKQIRQIAHQEVQAALADAGLSPDKIDDTMDSAIIEFIKKRAAHPGEADEGAQANNDASDGANLDSHIDISPLDAKNEPVAGDPDARYQLIIFSDYECPFCKRFWPTVEYVKDHYSDDLAIGLRDFPLTSIHGKAAMDEAIAARCVYEQAGTDAFWTYSNAIYTQTGSNGQGLSGDTPLVGLIGDLDLDVDLDQFNTCRHDPETKATVNAHKEEGSKAGIRGTPTSVLLDTKTGRSALIKGAQPRSVVTSGLDNLLGK